MGSLSEASIFKLVRLDSLQYLIFFHDKIFLNIFVKGCKKRWSVAKALIARSLPSNGRKKFINEQQK